MMSPTNIWLYECINFLYVKLIDIIIGAVSRLLKVHEQYTHIIKNSNWTYTYLTLH